MAEQLRETAIEIKEEVGAALAQARAELAALRQELKDQHTTATQPSPQPEVAAEPAAAEGTQKHSTLLKTAARVSSASLLCHRDIWEFITAHAGQHPHFRVPPRVADEEGERIRAALSGRSLIAVLISLHAVQHAATPGDGDQELATTLYERIEENLTNLTPNGDPVTITLDDRTLPAPHDTPELEAEPDAEAEAEADAEADSEPDTSSPPTKHLRTRHQPRRGNRPDHNVSPSPRAAHLRGGRAPRSPRPASAGVDSACRRRDRCAASAPRARGWPHGTGRMVVRGEVVSAEASPVVEDVVGLLADLSVHCGRLVTAVRAQAGEQAQPVLGAAAGGCGQYQ